MIVAFTSLPRAGLAAVLAYGLSSPVIAKEFSNSELKYNVAVPDDCATEVTTGTLEAICPVDSAAMPAAAPPKARSVFLEIDAEHAPPDAKPYGEAEFRADIPDAVCGAGEPGDVRIGNLAEAKAADSARVFTAYVVCPPISFLGLEERRASVRYVIGQKMRYRLMYRAPSSAFDKNAARGRAFLDSFRSTAE